MCVCLLVSDCVCVLKCLRVSVRLCVDVFVDDVPVQSPAGSPALM